ncbi:hypothetical protein BS47DRAFT_1210978 [Hydnum rufescens UP504]|uniref:Uncharacterized protein n=1 Tax=Hydnum rufescens UP504 TaxID=1448309 RepID=A0A9P6AS43_9AGAM|nr:hypothetical protein BS47DRAFT_1210978 [Hydnum rufescens UP504]
MSSNVKGYMGWWSSTCVSVSMVGTSDLIATQYTTHVVLVFRSTVDEIVTAALWVFVDGRLVDRCPLPARDWISDTSRAPLGSAVSTITYDSIEATQYTVRRDRPSPVECILSTSFTTSERPDVTHSVLLACSGSNDRMKSCHRQDPGLDGGFKY